MPRSTIATPLSHASSRAAAESTASSASHPASYPNASLAPKPYAIFAQNVCKRYGDSMAVDSISFQVERGSMTGLLGSSGGGKTTTIGMVAGLITTSSGSLEVLGCDICTQRNRAVARLSFSSPDLQMLHRLHVEENLRSFAALHGLWRSRSRILELAEAFQITETLRQPYGKLSSGQRSRVGVVKTLICQPELVLLDEPTGNLDPESAERMWRYLDAYCREHNITMLIISHDLEHVERWCDYLFIMHAGRIVVTGTPSQIAETYGDGSLRRTFARLTQGALIPMEFVAG